MRNRNDSQSAEFHGLSAADLLGATPSSQAKLATWRLMYTPGMYFNAASSGIMRWPGTFFVGGGVSKGMFQTLAEKTDRRWLQKGLQGAGGFFGGGSMTVLSKTESQAMKGINMFSKGGIQEFNSKMGYRNRKMAVTQLMDEGLPGMAKEAGMTTKSNLRYTRGRWMLGGYRGEALRGAGVRMDLAVDRSIVEKRTAAMAQRKTSGAVLKYMGLRTMGALSTVFTTALVFDVAATVGYGAVVGANALASKLGATNYLDFGAGDFRIAQSSGASTERQRALQAIQAHNLNARRFIGNEAAMMH